MMNDGSGRGRLSGRWRSEPRGMNEAPCCNVPVCNYIVLSSSPASQPPLANQTGVSQGPDWPKNRPKRFFRETVSRVSRFHDERWSASNALPPTNCARPKIHAAVLRAPYFAFVRWWCRPRSSLFKAAAGDAARGFAGPYHFSAETLANPPLIARIQGRTSRHPFESVRLALQPRVSFALVVCALWRQVDCCASPAAGLTAADS